MPPGKTPAPPAPPRTRTVREALAEALRREGPATARELSSSVGIREKDVAGHLEHLARSLAARGERLAVEPASCVACGYVFRERSRLSRPGACPACRSTRVEPPAFRVEEGQG